MCSPRLRHGIPALLALTLCPASLLSQSAPANDVVRQIKELSESITRVQNQINESQRQLDQMRVKLSTLEEAAKSGATENTELPSPPTRPSVTDIQERQDMQASQLATLQQIKVESDSKYPVTISGLLLFNGFVNSTRVDMAATPTSALFGSGSSGLSMRQTVLGIDARGPHLFGAKSYADIRVDFDGDPAGYSETYSGSYNANATLLRLRTAHVGLDWRHTGVSFALDRPILSPDAPTSLTAVAQPALAWSGNLWAWNPQAVISQQLPLATKAKLGLQLALIYASDAPETLAYRTSTSPQASTAEQSNRPGGEARIAILSAKEGAAHFGVGGYFAPHVSTTGTSFNAWAGTIDAAIRLGKHGGFSASSYRGQALGGLGAGEFKDYIAGTTANGTRYFRSLDAVGGWAELKQQINERLQFNEAFGVDQVFARQLRPVVGISSAGYLNYARNHTITGNVIYSPSAYLLFSFEYRRLETAPASGRLWISNVYGAAAAYRF